MQTVFPLLVYWQWESSPIENQQRIRPAQRTLPQEILYLTIKHKLSQATGNPRLALTSAKICRTTVERSLKEKKTVLQSTVKDVERGNGTSNNRREFVIKKIEIIAIRQPDEAHCF